MAIEHRYISELEELENNQVFCGQKIATDSNILIIGTFNPNDVSCLKRNTSTWFYGRTKSNFWRYLPTGLGFESLHPSDGHLEYPESWRKFCLSHDIVIIDLIKKIKIDEQLNTFGDKEVDCKINAQFTNVEIFNTEKAFRNVKFNKVVYSLAWKDNTIIKLKIIKDNTNRQLLKSGCINNEKQIKYCLTPSRNDARSSWHDALM